MLFFRTEDYTGNAIVHRGKGIHKPHLGIKRVKYMWTRQKGRVSIYILFLVIPASMSFPFFFFFILFLPSTQYAAPMFVNYMCAIVIRWFLSVLARNDRWKDEFHFNFLGPNCIKYNQYIFTINKTLLYDCHFAYSAVLNIHWYRKYILMTGTFINGN